MEKIVSIVILVFLFSCDGKKTNSDKMSSGEKIYSDNCISCHESEMRQDLSFHRLELSEIISKVKYGSGMMPSYEHILSAEEIENVAYYIYKLN